MHLTCEEIWDVSVLDQAIVSQHVPDEHKATISSILSSINRQTGVLKVKYKPSDSFQEGRLYANKGYQNVPGYIRRLSGHQYLEDLDLVNCFPSILLQIIQQNGIAAPYLFKYVTEREQCFDLIRGEHSTCGYSMPRDILKKAFLVILHNGSYRNATRSDFVDDKESKQIRELDSTFLDHFKQEMAGLNYQLMEVPELKPYAKAVNADGSKRNKAGTFISRICQVVENKVICCARDFLISHGISVDVLMFDGLMTRTEATPIEPALLLKCNEYVQQNTQGCLGVQNGFKVIFVKKSLTDKLEKDRLKLIEPWQSKQGLSRKRSNNTMLKRNIKRQKAGAELIQPQSSTASLRHRQQIKETISHEPLGISRFHGVEINFHNRDEEVSSKIFNFENETKCIVVQANMMNGKSRSMGEHIDAVTAINPDVRIAIITSRVQHANSLKGDLTSDDEAEQILSMRESMSPEEVKQYEQRNFKLYDEFNQEELLAQKKLIIQWESLYKLAGCAVFDYIYVDEIRSVAAQSVSELTNKNNLRTNADLARMLMRAATGVVLLDADVRFDGMVADFVAGTWSKSQQVCVHVYPRVALPKQLQQLQKTDFQNELQKDLDAGLKVVMMCRTRSQLEIRIKMIQQHREKRGLPKIVVAAYTGNTLKQIMLNWQDIDKHLTKESVQLLCYTSKVTVGSNINVKFDRQYIDCTGNGCSPRDIFQGSGRPRVLADTVIRVLLPEHVGSEELTFTEALTRLQRLRVSKLEYVQVLRELDVVQGKLQYTPDYLTHVAAWALREKSLPFTKTFYKLAKAKNYGWVKPFHSEMTIKQRVDMDNSLKDTKTEIKKEDKQLLIDTVKRISKLPYYKLEARHAELKLLSQQGSLSVTERKEYLCLCVVMKCKPSLDSELPEHEAKQATQKVVQTSLDAKTYEWAIKNISKAQQFKWIQYIIDAPDDSKPERNRELQMRDAFMLSQAGLPEFKTTLFDIIPHLQALVKVIGFKGLDDRTTSVSCFKPSAYPHITKLFHTMGRPRCQVKNGEILGMTRCLLGEVGLTLRSKRVGRDTDRHMIYFLEPHKYVKKLSKWLLFDPSKYSSQQQVSLLLRAIVDKPKVKVTSSRRFKKSKAITSEE